MAAATLLALLIPPEAGAAAASLSEIANPEVGAALFRRYCASCHGAAGRGDGASARILAVPPPDLTGLAAANGGRFPFRRAAARIDGRETLPAHGSPMPFYGAFFDADAVRRVAIPGGEIEASKPVLSILAYLAQIQDP